MNREVIIENIVSKIKQLPDAGIMEVNDFAEFLLSKIDDQIIKEGISSIIAESRTFEFLHDEEDLYTVNDLKERYR